LSTPRSTAFRGANPGPSDKGRRRTIHASIAGAAFMALVLSGCAVDRGGAGADGGGSTDWTPPEEVVAAFEEEGTIEVVDHNLSNSSVESQVIAAVLREMGADVEIVQVPDYAATWAALATNDDLIEMQMATDQHLDAVKKYMEEEKAVIGVDGGTKLIEGWYVPTYVIEGDAERGIEATCPGLPDWEALNDCVDVFATSETAPKGQYLSGAATWDYLGDAQRIENLGLDYELRFAGSEAALQAEWARAYERGEPLLAIMWEPHYLPAKYDLTKVALPEPTDDCWQTTYACDWPDMNFSNLVSSGFPDKHPTAMALLENYKFENAWVGDMVVTMEEEGASAAEVVEVWMQENPDVWQAWTPEV
jgi:glycine betaine/proline transport system substrate-binding protein